MGPNSAAGSGGSPSRTSPVAMNVTPPPSFPRPPLVSSLADRTDSLRVRRPHGQSVATSGRSWAGGHPPDGVGGDGASPASPRWSRMNWEPGRADVSNGMECGHPPCQVDDMTSRPGPLLCVAVLSVLQGSCATDTTLSGDPLSPAWSGQVQCYVPDTTRRECSSIGAYRRGPDGVVFNEATVLISSAPHVVMTTVAPVRIKGGAICGSMSQDDVVNSTFAVSGAPATAEQAAALKRQMILAMQPLFGKEVCTSITTKAGSPMGEARIDGRATSPR